MDLVDTPPLTRLIKSFQREPVHATSTSPQESSLDLQGAQHLEEARGAPGSPPHRQAARTQRSGGALQSLAEAHQARSSEVTLPRGVRPADRWGGPCGSSAAPAAVSGAKPAPLPPVQMNVMRVLILAVFAALAAEPLAAQNTRSADA